jgi:sterol desaturase/sphingolipid hydroxylase (fatty acid hydroxylase superfamily)
VGGWFISATHHGLHHRRFRCNYGLHFRLWDRLLGTDAMPPVRETP